MSRRLIVPVLVLLTVLVDLAAVVASACPGALESLFTIALFVAATLLPFVTISAIVLRALRGAPAAVAGPDAGAVDEIAAPRARVSVAKWVVVGLVIAIGCVVLVKSGIPRRAAFRYSEPSFQRLVASTPVADFSRKILKRRVGLYHVDEYAFDARGGVYFRTHTGYDVIDTISYGFAFRPNRKGSPFGNASYSDSRINGDWYVFRASNDY